MICLHKISAYNALLLLFVLYQSKSILEKAVIYICVEDVTVCTPDLNI